MSVPKAPPGLAASGRKLWRSVLAEFELDDHEVAGLLQACRCADACDELAEVLRAEGRMSKDHLGNPRVHPAAVELRATQMVLLRAIASLRIPLGEESDEGERPQRRGAARGAYGIRGAV